MKIAVLFFRPLWRLSVLVLELLQRSAMLLLALLLLFFWWLAEAPWQESLPALFASFGITLQEFSGTPTNFTISGLQLSLPAEPSEQSADKMQPQQSMADGEVRIKRLHGQLQLRPWPQTPLLTLSSHGIRVIPPTNPPKPFSLPPPFRLPILPEMLPLTVEIQLSDIQVNELSLEKLTINAKNHGSDWQWQGEVNAITLPLLPKFSLALSGHYAVAEGQLHLNINSDLFDAKQKVSLAGNRDGGRLSFGQEEKNGGRWQVDSQVTWYPDYTVRLKWDIEKLLLQTWLQTIPELWQLIEPYWEKMPLDALNSQGNVRLESISIKNNVADFQLFLDLNLDSALSKQPLNLLLKNAELTPEKIDFEVFKLSLGDQVLNMGGQASFSGLNLNGRFNFPKLSAVYPDFSGSVIGNFAARGNWPWPKVQAEAEIKNLAIDELKVKTLLLKAKSQASNRAELLPAINVEVSGNNWQFIDNYLEKLDFFLATPGFSLKNFPEALLKQWPPLLLTAKVDNLKSASFTLNKTTLKADINNKGQADINSKLEDLIITAIPEQKISSDLQLQGDLATHTLALNVQHPEMALRLQLNAGVRGDFWQGSITDLFFQEKQLGKLKLAKKSAFKVSATGNISLDDFCLEQSPTVLCQNFDFSEQIVKTKGFFKQLSLEKFKAYLPAEVALQGTVQAEWQGQLQLQNLAQSQGQLQLSTSPLTLTLSALTPALTWNFSPLTLALRWQDGLQSLLQLSGDYGLKLNVEGQSSSNGDQLKGGLIFEINKLETAIAPYVGNFGELKESRLSLQAEVAGTLSDIQPSGKLSLSIAKFMPYALEQPFENIAFTAESNDGQDVVFQLTATSEKTLTVTGLLKTTTDLPITWQVKGADVKITNLPEAQVWLTPDLTGSFSLNNGLALKGQLTIPKARVVLKKLPANTVKVSSDARMVTKESAQTSTALPLAIRSDILLVLGEDVSVQAFDFKSFLQGELRLKQQGEQSEAQGRLILKDGQYRAYGQDLRIDPGFIFFTGPLTAPSVDITAFRQKLENQKVGIRLLGAVEAPQVSFLSEPKLSDADALSYLVTGKALNKLGKGDGNLLQSVLKSTGLDFGNQVLAQIGGRLGLDSLALIEGSGDALTNGLRLGKYLSPRLYLEYLTGNPETLKLQYQLNQRLKLQLEQSQDYQAVDLLYSFEK
jgi:autotransporter translocation and assembly factor TamB